MLVTCRLDDEDRVGNSLLQIWELRYGHKAKLLFRLWSRFRSCSLGEILNVKFGQCFAADVWLRLKLNLDQDSGARFGQDFKFKLSGDTDVWLRF